MSHRLWIVVPVYFDVESFLILREQALKVLEREDVTAEPRFAVLDDSAGRDLRFDELAELADVRVIRAPFNLGHQRGIVHALRILGPEITDEDIVVTMDSDGEDRPEDLPRLLAELHDAPPHSRRAALALRTRRRTSVAFKIFYFFFRLFFRLLTGTSVRTGNFAAYKGWLAKHMLTHPYFDLCYSSTLLTLDLDLEFIPCERGERYAGQSRMGFSKLFMHGLRMLMPFMDRIAIRALLLFSITLATSLAGGVVVVTIKLLTDAAVPGWATNAVVGMLILSFLALANSVTLFAVFSQSRAISLANLEDHDDA